MELTNITELIRTEEICRLLRLCGIDERQIGADASDYEFFSALCHAVPLLMGHPLPHALDDALQSELGVTLPLSPDFCDTLWKACADRLLSMPRFQPLTLTLSDAPKWMPPKWYATGTHFVLDGSKLLQTKSSSWSEWEAEMQMELDLFCKSGGGVVSLSPDAAACAEAPNLYRVEQLLRKGESAPMLTSQVFRFLVVELQKRNRMLWLDTALCGKQILNLLHYAERTMGLPSLIWTGTGHDTCQALWKWQSCAHDCEIRYAVSDAVTENQLQAIARSYPIGRLWKLSSDRNDAETLKIYHTS